MYSEIHMFRFHNSGEVGCGSSISSISHINYVSVQCIDWLLFIRLCSVHCTDNVKGPCDRICGFKMKQMYSLLEEIELSQNKQMHTPIIMNFINNAIFA